MNLKWKIAKKRCPFAGNATASRRVVTAEVRATDEDSKSGQRERGTGPMHNARQINREGDISCRKQKAEKSIAAIQQSGRRPTSRAGFGVDLRDAL
jgi:hypothetical protein